MKKITLTICALFLALLTYGQSPVDRSKLQFNAGVGLSTWGIPLYAGADYWITPEITGGIEVSFRYSLWSNYASIGASVNGNYHVNKLLQLPEAFDAYAGISAGPYFNFGHYWTHPLRLGIGLQVGGRYQINERMAFHVEVGGGTLSGGKAGITFRM